MQALRIFIFFLCTLPLLGQARDVYKIVTASERGTYIRIGQDLSQYVASSTDIGLEVLPSNGSAENVMRLRYEPGVKLALVQSDVYQAFLDQAKAGHATAARIVRPLRVILPLYNEEIYFVTRADSALRSIHEIKDKRINVGPVGSGTALTATTLYRMMFNTPMKESQVSYLSNEEALLKLANGDALDVAVIVAGQPAKIFTEMKPEARQFIKLLSLDDNAPETSRAKTTYFPATIRSNNYPSWMNEDTPTLSVKALLVTYDYDKPTTQAGLSTFANALCTNFATLQSSGHPKWKEVKIDLPPLGKGWSYYPPVERALRSCQAERSASMRPTGAPVAKSCTHQEKILGFCGF